MAVGYHLIHPGTLSRSQYVQTNSIGETKLEQHPFDPAIGGRQCLARLGGAFPGGQAR